MAAVLQSAGTVKECTLTGEALQYIWISPSSMDSNDTVVMPTVAGKSLGVLSAFDNTTGDAVTCSVSSYTLTVDAAGGTQDHVYVITYFYY
jgi:hypothetical protein